MKAIFRSGHPAILSGAGSSTVSISNSDGSFDGESVRTVEITPAGAQGVKIWFHKDKWFIGYDRHPSGWVVDELLTETE